MIRGHLDLSFLTDKMLADIEFSERNYVADANGSWIERGIDRPDYPADGPIVLQSFDSACPEWAHKIKDMFPNIHYKKVSVNCLTPGCFIPPHRDELFKLKQFAITNNINTTHMSAIRVNILLQDKKHGHFLDLNNKVLGDYAKGDYVYIIPGVLHSVANIGHENRYTLQISGFVADEDL
jgi:hypothetical protein